MSNMDDPRAWKVEEDPENLGQAVQKLRVFLDTITAEFFPSGLKNAGKFTEVEINSSTWTALPATPLTDRNAMAIQNNSNTNVKVNYDNSVSGYEGMTISKRGGERQYDIKDSIVIYAKSESGTVTLDVEELS